MLTPICQKIKTSRDLDHFRLGDNLSSHDLYFSGQPLHKIWRFYLQPLQRNLKDSSISHSGDISGGVKSCNVSSGPGHAHLGDSLSSKGYYFSEPNGAKKLRRHVTVTTPTWG